MPEPVPIFVPNAKYTIVKNPNFFPWLSRIAIGDTLQLVRFEDVTYMGERWIVDVYRGAARVVSCEKFMVEYLLRNGIMVPVAPTDPVLES